jgi:hypothetical protein
MGTDRWTDGRGGRRRTFAAADAADTRFFARPFLVRLEEEKSDLAKESLNIVGYL